MALERRWHSYALLIEGLDSFSKLTAGDHFRYRGRSDDGLLEVVVLSSHGPVHVLVVLKYTSHYDTGHPATSSKLIVLPNSANVHGLDSGFMIVSVSHYSAT